jgi:hypothetical protein
MATIVTRAGKGSALTFVEGDANFTNLNTDKIELNDLSVGTPASASGSGSIAYNNTTGVFTYTPPEIPSAGIGAVVDDTAPVLGGDLDVDEYKITTTSSTVALTIEAYQDAGFSFDLETNASTGVAPLINVNGIISLNDSTGVNYGAVTTQNNTTGLYLGINELDLDLPNINLDPAGFISIYGIGGDTPGVEILSDGAVSIQALIYPAADGTAGQVLTTDGEGNLTFEDAAAGGIANLVDDTTPQLGGNLDVLTYGITTTTANGSIVLTANGEGSIELDSPVTLNTNRLSYGTGATHGVTFDINGMVSLGYIKSFGENIYTSTTTTGTWAPNAADAPLQYVPMTGNMTVNGFTSGTGGQTITIIFDGTGGSYTLTLGADILTPGGTGALTSGGIDLVTITLIDDETPVYIATIVNDFQ